MLFSGRYTSERFTAELAIELKFWSWVATLFSVGTTFGSHLGCCRLRIKNVEGFRNSG